MRWRNVPSWAAALLLFVIALDTVPDVLDVDAVDGGLLPLVAAAAALPVGVVATWPTAGWLVSAGSALLVSQVFPVVDGDPWRFPIVHGMVVLALLFAVSVPDRLRVGSVAGVTAVVVAALVARLLRPPQSRAEETHGDVMVPGAVVDQLKAGFGEAFVSWADSPPLGRSLERRFPTVPWIGTIQRVLPWVLALGVFGFGLATIHDSLQVHDLVLPFLVALIALPVGLLGRHALHGWRLIIVLAVVLALAGTSSDGTDPGTWPVIFQWVWVVTSFVVTVRHGRRVAFWVWVVAMAVIATGLGDDRGAAATLAGAISVVIFIGDLVRSRLLTGRALERQTELSELEKARRTVLEERARIARDLHDVVAHHMSMVVVQAESAPYRLTELSPEAAAELDSIGGSARKALLETRTLLGVLRSEEQPESDTARAPQPVASDVQELVDGAARSGMSVSLATTGGVRALGAAGEIAVYRIVQESLANAARHAPGTAVQVELAYRADGLHFSIANKPPLKAPTSGAAGHGIVGMRERAAVAGGTLEVVPHPDGAFQVRASLPYAESPREGEREQ